MERCGELKPGLVGDGDISYLVAHASVTFSAMSCDGTLAESGREI